MSKELIIGSELPSFELMDQHGNLRSSEEFRGKKNLVVYFYPKDDTPGCTLEAKGFRDQYEDFLNYDCEVIGISFDSVESHQNFCSNYELPFVLLSDSKRKVSKQFGVSKTWFGLVSGRETFVFNKEGLLISKFAHQMFAHKHVVEALKALKEDATPVV